MLLYNFYVYFSIDFKDLKEGVAGTSGDHDEEEFEEDDDDDETEDDSDEEPLSGGNNTDDGSDDDKNETKLILQNMLVS